MRFMMIVIPDGYAEAEPGAMPDAKGVAEMMEYNRALQKAGVLLALDGLHPPSEGTRVTWKGGTVSITDGPFAEAKEAIGGYWLIDVKSKQEAIEWARRCPSTGDGTIEIRQVQEFDEFPEDVRAAAGDVSMLPGS